MSEYLDKKHLIAPVMMKLLEFNKQVMNWLEINLLVAENSPKRIYDVIVEFLAIDKMLTELEDKKHFLSMDEMANRLIRKDMAQTLRKQVYEEEMKMNNTVTEVENSDTKKKKKAPKQDPNKQKKDVKNPPKKKK